MAPLEQALPVVQCVQMLPDVDLKYSSIAELTFYILFSVRGVLLPQTEEIVWNTQSSSLQVTTSSILVSLGALPQIQPWNLSCLLWYYEFSKLLPFLSYSFACPWIITRSGEIKGTKY